jgi:hypothetical protein
MDPVLLALLQADGIKLVKATIKAIEIKKGGYRNDSHLKAGEIQHDLRHLHHQAGRVNGRKHKSYRDSLPPDFSLEADGTAVGAGAEGAGR